MAAQTDVRAEPARPESGAASVASRREPLRVGSDVLAGDAELLGGVDREPEAFVPVGVQAALGDELGERRRLVVAPLREALDRLLGEDVDAAVHPVRDPASLAEALDDVVLAEVDDAER